MRNLTLALGVAACAITAPVMARDGQLYIEAGGGPVFVEDFPTDIASTLDATETSSEYGYEIAGLFGYDWGLIRTEVEGSYRGWDLDTIVVGDRGIPAATAQPASGSFGYDGDIQMTSVMANLLLDFGGEGGVGFAVGAGAGRTWMNVDGSVSAAGPGYLDDSDDTWAWQALAQLRAPISDSTEISLKYRYFSTLEFELVDTIGRNNEFELAGHSLMLGAVVNLGG